MALAMSRRTWTKSSRKSSTAPAKSLFPFLGAAAASGAVFVALLLALAARTRSTASTNSVALAVLLPLSVRDASASATVLLRFFSSVETEASAVGAVVEPVREKTWTSHVTAAGMNAITVVSAVMVVSLSTPSARAIRNARAPTIVRVSAGRAATRFGLGAWVVP